MALGSGLGCSCSPAGALVRQHESHRRGTSRGPHTTAGAGVEGPGVVLLLRGRPGDRWSIAVSKGGVSDMSNESGERRKTPDQSDDRFRPWWWAECSLRRSIPDKRGLAHLRATQGAQGRDPECDLGLTSARTMDSSYVITGGRMLLWAQLPVGVGEPGEGLPAVSDSRGGQEAVPAEEERRWRVKVEERAWNSSFGERKIWRGRGLAGATKGLGRLEAHHGT